MQTKFHSVIGFYDTPTADHRIIAENALSWELPLPVSIAGDYEYRQAVGKVDRIENTGNVLHAYGSIDSKHLEEARNLALTMSMTFVQSGERDGRLLILNGELRELVFAKSNAFEGTYTNFQEPTPEELEARQNGGWSLIYNERMRQISKGHTAESDSRRPRELMHAASGYLQAAIDPGLWVAHYRPPIMWPWEEQDWHPEDNARDNLVKAGGLIAAALDALNGHDMEEAENAR
jgi:hypothetical protein